MFSSAFRKPFQSAFAKGDAAPAFAPTDIVGLVAWYDFSDITTLFQDSARTIPVTGDADLIGGVTDKSSAGNHLAQGTAAARPTYKTGIQNSKSIARSDGSDFLGKSISLGTTHTILFASKVVGAGGTVNIGGSAGAGYSPYVEATPIYYSTGGTNFVSVNHGLALPRWAIIRIVRTGTSVSFFVNASQVGATQTLGANTAWTLGSILAYPNGSFGGAIDGGEYFVFTTNPSAAEISNLLAFVNEKWAVY